MDERERRPTYDVYQHFVDALNAHQPDDEFESLEEFRAFCLLLCARNGVSPSVARVIKLNHLEVPGTEHALYYIWSRYRTQ